jgi:transposase
MYTVLDKDTIEMEIVPYIPAPKRGFPPTVPLSEIIDAVLHKLKTGVQWEQLPVRSLFSGKALTRQGVYYHFDKWGRSGTFKDCRARFLGRHRGKLDLSSGDLDGSHTPAIRGGQGVAYQGRKKRKTTNALYLTDRQGLPLAMSEPVRGNHNDLYDIEVRFELVTATLEEADIPVEGLFLNADAGFDPREFRKACRKKGGQRQYMFQQT